MDSGRPSACALPMSIAQETLGRHAGALKDFLVNRKAVILLSGGLDSATVLALAREQGFEPYALSVSYGQRHIAELAAAPRVADALGAVRHQTLPVHLDAVGGSALTDRNIDVPASPSPAGRSHIHSLPPPHPPSTGRAPPTA